jgi:hypothetical protein
MSKDAVVMAYGYPPDHKTPSLKTDLWTYWENRLISITVQFADGKAAVVGNKGVR